MGVGALQPMHLFVILVIVLALIVLFVGIALFLVRYGVRYAERVRREGERTSPPGPLP